MDDRSYEIENESGYHNCMKVFYMTLDQVKTGAPTEKIQ